MQTIYLYTNHNYYNRIIKRYTTIAEYNSALKPGPVYANINFIIRDGVRTEQVVNYDSAYGEYASGAVAPSYLIVTDELGDILHRWWVIESKMNRGGQATLQLLRDVIADNYDLTLNAISFIEKGYIDTVNDNAIFNDEDMSFNQIKTRETPITDASKCPWYIGYLSKDLDSKVINVPEEDYAGAEEYNNLEDYPYYQYGPTNPYIGDYNLFNFNFLCHNIRSVSATPSITFNNYQITWDQNGAREEALYIPINVDGEDIYFGKATGDEPIGYAQAQIQASQYDHFGIMIAQNNPWDNEIGDRIYNETKKYTDWKTQTYGFTSAHKADISTLLEQDDLIIKVGGALYQVSVAQNTIQKRETISNDTLLGQLVYERIINPINAEHGGSFDTTAGTNGDIVSITYEATAYTVSVNPIDRQALSVTLPSNRRRTAGAAYDIIAIPAKPIYISAIDTEALTSAELSKKIVSAMISQTPSGTDAKLLYDFQLLPYCPLSDRYFTAISGKEYAQINLTYIHNSDRETKYTIVGNSDRATVILYIDQANFNKTSFANPIEIPDTPIAFKVANQCDSYRLCSPNYNGQFEFSATKNGGVTSWNISCAYKPFTPYVRVSPNFGRLYGRDFGDARGLVCGGDFSVTQTSDAWENYELANKNYQNIFDRQITNMEVNNSVQRELEAWNVATGTVSGAVGGAIGGAAVGGGYGAIAGAAIGGTTSLLGGMQDIRLNEKLRREAIDYAKDQYGYQLQNIKALPYSLTKVGSQTSDYKLFPFVEYYTCSRVEKNALENKIRWNGMTIMRIGLPLFFLGGNRFIKCKPIRIQGLNDESHIAEVISAELREGVYIE